MNDAISRSELIRILREWPDHLGVLVNPTCEEYAERYGNLEALSAILGEVERLPALDAVPVVHARWNEEDGTCSVCYHEACYDEWTEPKWDYDWDENLVQTGEETHIQFIFSPYCPNCGARMDGDADAV